VAKILVKEECCYDTFEGKKITVYYCTNCNNGGQSPMNKYCSNCGEEFDKEMIFEK